MRTSAHQYDLIVTYMEQHGDITKPLSNNAQGKLRALQKWAELQHILNADGSGDSKTIDKWKKADLKNNTKKKAARIHKSVCGTGGGPATTLKHTPDTFGRAVSQTQITQDREPSHIFQPPVEDDCLFQ
ncbi:hypothetical protein ABMA28_009366 [Loxostege sticticalis]|uniref:Regulatory protein zeste n=1 Tax=Loxostege sticticalis TaxID=481309 RepID=A0ABD0SD42_LOXSC